MFPVRFFVFSFAAATVSGLGSDSVAHATENATFRNVGDSEDEDLVQMLEIYNTNAIRERWSSVDGNLTERCRTDMASYLAALDTKDLWALKALDATGRYSSGFFWGNSYWTGSETLCNNIGFQRKHYTSNGNLPTGSRTEFVEDEPSPFSFGFYKVRARITLPGNIAPVQTVLLGLCIPHQCTQQDVRALMNVSPSSAFAGADRSTINILGVRTPHDYYLFWKDQIFWVLTGVTALVTVMLFTGTAYDYLREKTSQSNLDGPLVNISVLLNGKGKIRNNITQSFVNHAGPEMGAVNSDGVKFDRSTNSLAISDNDQSSVSSDPDLTHCWRGILLSFSLRENLKVIFDKSVGSDTIPTVHGLRSLSMVWVILCHTCIVIFKYSDNMEFRTIMERQILFQAITNGSFSVDTFFFISGLLVSFLYFRTTARVDVTSITGAVGLRSNAIQFFGLLAYRYWRLTAPYMFVLGCVQVFMKMFYYNAVFDPPANDHENCPAYWWRNALYINTLFPVQQMCMLWSWYLADDTQFFILGVILLIIAVGNIKAAAGLLFAFLVSSWATTAYVAYNNNHLPSQDDPLALFDKLYDKPWTRLGPYLIGMIMGWILFKTECKIKMSKLVVTVGWLASTAVLLSLVYGLYEADLDSVTSAAYSSLSHSAWALAMSWVVLACSTGHGGLINKVLSASVLYPFSRVTYCAYLIHPLVIRSMIVNLDNPLHLNKEIVMFLFFGLVVVSYILAFIISLAFEAPVVSLAKLVSPTRASKTVP